MRSNRITTLLLTIGLLVLFLNVKRQENADLYGKWELINKELIKDSDLFPDKGFPELYIDFKQDGEVITIQDGEKMESIYRLEGNQLTLGNRKYILREITAEKLIIEEDGPILNHSLTFRRIIEL